MKRKLLTLGLLLIVFTTLLAQVRVYEESQSRIASAGNEGLCSPVSSQS